MNERRSGNPDPPGAETEHIAGAGPGQQGEADPRRWRALALLAMVQFMLFVDATVVNIALPNIGRDLSMSPVNLAWVVNGYLLMAGGLLLIGGRLSDLVGRRTMFLLGTAVFAVASLTSGLAQNGAMLIGSRFAQGVGEALAAPAALAIVALLFTDPKERAKAFGIWGGIAGAGAVVGTLLSGVITDLVNWRWVFLINIPIAAIPLILVPLSVSPSRGTRDYRRIDVLGALLVTSGMFAIVYGLLNAGRHGWDDRASWVSLLGGLLALVLFFLWESRAPAPLVPLRFFRNRTRVAANIATVLVGGSMIGMFFLAVLYMQGILGFSPLEAGLAYMPFMATFSVGLVLSTNLFPTLGARNTIAIGLVASAAGMFLLTRIEAGGSYWSQLMPALLVLGFGLGVVNPAVANAALHRVSTADAGLASGVQTTVTQLGSAAGISVLVAFAVQRTADLVSTGRAVDQATVDGFSWAFMLAGFALLAGAVVILLVMERSTQVTVTPGAPPVPVAEAPVPEGPVVDAPVPQEERRAGS